MEIKVIQILLFQGIFLFIYNFWLRKETFYTSNRVYLLGTSVLAVLIPFISINIVPESAVATQIVALSELVLNPNSIQLPEVLLTSVSSIPTYSLILWLYSGGILLAISLFFWKISKLVLLIFQNKKKNKEGYIVVALPESTSVFSFLNYIFIGEQILDKDASYLMTHEQVHIRQRHTLDLLWFEILKIILWFNPFVYLYQRYITALHEFIADAESIKLADTKTYYNHILNDLFQVENMAFVNQFYNKSLIQKRITMMSKTQSQKWKKVKYLFILPLLFMMLFIGNVSGQETEDVEQKNLEAIVSFFNAHEDSRNLTEIQYIEYTNLMKKVYHEKKIKSFEKYKAEVNSNKDYHLYEVSRANDEKKLVNKAKDGSVPFNTIDQVPIYPGCEEVKDKAEQRNCLSKKIQEHVSKIFNIDMVQNLGLTPGKKRIFAMFKIDKEGNITSIRSRALHKDLELEAVRVIKTLPKMKPGRQDGKAVGVKYSLPISFLVEDNKVNEKK